MTTRSLAALTATGLTGAALIAGCGSSSKPAYCTQVANLQSSVHTLEQVEVNASNLPTIKADVQKVGTSAKELETAVKGEFASQITSIKTSVSALEASLKEVAAAPSSSTLAHTVSVVPAQIEALKKSTSEIQEVTKSKCE